MTKSIVKDQDLYSLNTEIERTHRRLQRSQKEREVNRTDFSSDYDFASSTSEQTNIEEMALNGERTSNVLINCCS